LNRRRFLKYAGAASAVAGASALGLDYVLQKPANLSQTTTSTLDQTPPTIGDFQWLQDASKMHDGTIKFSVSDTSGVASARLNLVPVFPSEIPAAAIPAEDWIDFPSATSNVTLPTKSVQFSQAVADLKGGKTYTTNIIAKDTAGNQAIRSYDIPYVREFENVSSKCNLTIDAHYMPFFSAGTWPIGWDNENETPLLGNYDSSDEFVVSKHIDWASGFGIKSFSLNWAGQNDFANGNIKTMLANPLMQDMNFFILLATDSILGVDGPWDIDDPAIRKQLLDGTEYLVQNFLTHPSYLQIQGAKPIYYYASISWEGDVLSLTNAFRKTAKNYGIDLYVIGDPVQFYKPSADRIIPFDAITQWANYDKSNGDTQHILQNVTNHYQKWANSAKSNNVSFIPSVMPGFRKPPHFQNFATTPRDMEFFKSQLEIGRQYTDPLIKMLFVSTFNDWTENTGVEPTLNEEFAYLQALENFAKSF
jgi:hypothetical protein